MEEKQKLVPCRTCPRKEISVPALLSHVYPVKKRDISKEKQYVRDRLSRIKRSPGRIRRRTR